MVRQGWHKRSVGVWSGTVDEIEDGDPPFSILNFSYSIIPGTPVFTTARLFLLFRKL